jgi:hypothetical protein
MLRLLLPSISTSENCSLPVTGSMTNEYYPGLGMWFG